MDLKYPKQPIDRITPEKLFFSRRKFLRLAAMFGTAYALAACGIGDETAGIPETLPTIATSTAPELAPLTAEDKATNFTNFYEFSVDKYEPSALAQTMQTSPWPIEISGLVDKPQTLDAAEIINTYGGEERVYRLRCVEGWSMVIPWYGFPLNKLLADLSVRPEAKYIKFTTLHDPDQMQGQRQYYYFTWPYTEGLRLDEAQNDLALLAWGMYGKELTKQNGAPLRLVVPWKYGFKSIKSIAKIELTAEQPATFWNTSAPGEYGFYANVNPNVDHPRWSQLNEFRVGETGNRPTLLFNGYEDEVSYLYEGMDLTKDY